MGTEDASDPSRRDLSFFELIPLNPIVVQFVRHGCSIAQSLSEQGLTDFATLKEAFSVEDAWDYLREVDVESPAQAVLAITGVCAQIMQLRLCEVVERQKHPPISIDQLLRYTLIDFLKRHNIQTDPVKLILSILPKEFYDIVFPGLAAANRELDQLTVVLFERA